MKKKEKLKADLENNYYLFDTLKDKSKLELINLLRHRDNTLSKQRLDDYINGEATITVKKDGEIIQEIHIDPVQIDVYEFPKEAVFDIANKLHWIYGDGEVMGLEVYVNFKI
jgi:hypothetical protein